MDPRYASLGVDGIERLEFRNISPAIDPMYLAAPLRSP